MGDAAGHVVGGTISGRTQSAKETLPMGCALCCTMLSPIFRRAVHELGACTTLSMFMIRWWA